MSSNWPSLTSAFKYEPLNLDRPAFRLLRLKSARDSQATIECEIIQAYFDVEHVPDYEAISYTWGALTSPRKIQLDGSVFLIRFNLWSVLRDVRRQDEDRILWVDAICINQDDVRERGHQVQQIRHVYEQAERVIFWLGQLTNPSIDILMDLLTELQGRTRGVRWSLTDPRWRRQWEQIPKGSLDNLRAAFQEILERPWFRRVWILQEVANARAGLVHCGHKSLSAKILAVCPTLLEIKPNQHCQAVLDVMPGPSRSGSWWEQDRRLHTLLRKFSKTEATRDHDRIFALFGLCPEANAQITVDYTKPMPQLLRETVSYILKDNPFPYDIGSLPCLEYDSIETLLKDIDTLHSRILEHLLEHESGGIVEDFLLRFQDQLAITPDLCITAMKREDLGNTFISSILHRNPQSPQVEDHQGRTPLLVATASGNEVFMRVLVENGAEFKDLPGFPPLLKASELTAPGPASPGLVKSFVSASTAFRRDLRKRLRSDQPPGDVSMPRSRAGSTIEPQDEEVELRPPRESGWIERGLVLARHLWVDATARVVEFTRALRRPGLAPGYIRISWSSARGRELYMDLKTSDKGAAMALQKRFRGLGLSHSSGTETSSPSGGGRPLDGHVQATGAGGVSPPPSQPADKTQRNSDTSSRQQTETAPASTTSTHHRNREKRYLLLCFSIMKAKAYRQIDLTGITNDQMLFEAMHRSYLDVRWNSSWKKRWKYERAIRLLELFSFFAPKQAEFVQFTLMPIQRQPGPYGIKGGLPPEEEVLEKMNWHYEPCPSYIEHFVIDEAFLAILMDPGHAFEDDAWTLLFPKKLRSEFKYIYRQTGVAWGVHIVDGLNYLAVAGLSFLVFLGSGLLGIAYSVITKDPGAGFTIAAWFASTTALGITTAQLYTARA